MVAVDTNVLVRLLTQDDAAQFRKAEKLFREERVLITKTVLLETEWVLRRLYKYGPGEVAAALESLADLETVRLEDPAECAQAIQWMGDGLDFADALHLAGSSFAERFATFDSKFARRAQQIGRRVQLL